MFNIFKKRLVTPEEKVRKLFKCYFRPFKYPEWQHNNGIHSLPDSGIVVFSENRLKVEDIDYLLDSISKNKHVITDEKELKIVEHLEESFKNDRQKIAKDGKCTLGFIVYELIFLCDKILNNNTET